MLFRGRCHNGPSAEANSYGCGHWSAYLNHGAAYGYSRASYQYTVAADVCPRLTDANSYLADNDTQTNQHTDRHTDANSCPADAYGYP